MLFFEIWWDALHDLLCLGRVIDFKCVQILRSPKLELGALVLFVFLDSDLFGLGKMLFFSPHDLDKLLQVLNFFWLHDQIIKNLPLV